MCPIESPLLLWLLLSPFNFSSSFRLFLTSALYFHKYSFYISKEHGEHPFLLWPGSLQNAVICVQVYVAECCLKSFNWGTKMWERTDPKEVLEAQRSKERPGEWVPHLVRLYKAWEVRKYREGILGEKNWCASSPHPTPSFLEKEWGSSLQEGLQWRACVSFTVKGQDPGSDSCLSKWVGGSS